MLEDCLEFVSIAVGQRCEQSLPPPVAQPGGHQWRFECRDARKAGRCDIREARGELFGDTREQGTAVQVLPCQIARLDQVLLAVAGFRPASLRFARRSSVLRCLVSVSDTPVTA